MSYNKRDVWVVIEGQEDLPPADLNLRNGFDRDTLNWKRGPSKVRTRM